MPECPNVKKLKGWVRPECQKLKRGRLDQYGTEGIDRLIFATVRRRVRLKGLKPTHSLIPVLFSVISKVDYDASVDSAV